MDLLSSFFDDIPSQEPAPLPTHLDAPIKDHMIKLLLKRKHLDRRTPRWIKTKLNAGHTYLENLIKKHGIKTSLETAQEGISTLQRQLLKINIDNSNCQLISENYKQLLKYGKIICEAQIRSLGLVPDICDLESLTQTIEPYLYSKILYQQGVLLTGSKKTELSDPILWTKAGPGFYSWIGPSFEVHISGDWLFIHDYQSLWIGTREHLLLLSDLCAQRVIILMYAELGRENNLTTVPDPDTVNKVFNWGDQILEDFGNPGYDLLSQWESLCVGVLISESDDEFCDPTVFLRNMKQAFDSTFPGSSDYSEPILSLLKTQFHINPNLVTQLYGLYRIWGHPTVNAAGGIAKLKQHACRVRPINHQMILKINCIFKERFCMDYRAQHGRWPNLDLTGLVPTSFLYQQLSNNLPLPKKDPRYTLLAWNKVKSSKTFEILPKYNLVKLLSDKAMSLGISELSEEVKRGTIGPAWKRSVLTKWLESEIGDPGLFLEDICQNGFGADECIVGVCPKERELKLWARLFGLLTLKKRMYVVLTEAMLAEHVLPYFPEITMLDSYTTLMKKMYHSTKDSCPSRKKSGISVYTSMDFQKWNSNMREEETLEIFGFLDGLFGLKNCYTRTHEMFKNAQLYLADGTYIPTIRNGQLKEDEYCWSGHLGGIEGLRQKGWTLFTVCIIRYALDDLDVQHYLMGQGDNQVLKLIFPLDKTASEIRLQHTQILKKLEDIFKQIGPPIKPSESWSSSCLFIYGKFPIFKGCPLSMSLKKLCRMFPFSNEGYPTLESSLSSISASLLSACNSSIIITPIFLTYCVQSLECIMWNLKSHYLTPFQNLQQSRHLGFKVPTGSGGQNFIPFLQSKDFLTRILSCDFSYISLLLIFPRCLGGYPVTLLGNLLSNGFPDPVSENISLLRKLYNVGFAPQLIKNILSPDLNSYISAEMICEDPVSLNLLHPSSPKEVVKRLVQSYLGGATWIKNQEFKSFINLALMRQEDLCKSLMTMKPFNPRIAHAIQEATLVGRAIQVVGQLEKTNTLISLMQKHTSENLIMRIRNSDLNYFMSVVYNLSITSPITTWEAHICSRVWAQKLRDLGWGLPLTGVTVAPIQETFTLRSESLNCRDHPNPELGYFLIIPDHNSSQLVWESNIILGPHDPYIGSVTEEKTKSYGKDLARKSQPILTNAAKLLTLINWATSQESELSNLIKALFNSITDMDPDRLIPIAGQIAGSVEHRFLDTGTKHGGSISTLYSLATWFHLSSNTLTEYKSGTENVNLHFQALMGISIVMSYLHLRSKNQLRTLHYHVDCKDCVIPINETPIDIDPHPWNQLLKSLPGNPICWISKDKIITEEHLDDFLEPITTLSENHQDLYLAFHQLLGQECFKEIRYHTWESGDGKRLTVKIYKLNVTWVNKLDLRLLVDDFLLQLCNNLIFKMDWTQMDHIVTRDDLFFNLVNLVSSIPKPLLRWAYPLYLNSRVLDQMRNLFSGLSIPASVPLTYNDIEKHFSQVLIIRLSQLSLQTSQLTSTDCLYSYPSRCLDGHPFFLYLTRQMLLSGSDGEIIDILGDYKIGKLVLSNHDLSLGNNLSIKRCTLNTLMFNDSTESRIPHLKSFLFRYQNLKLIWVDNHLDKICKQIQTSDPIDLFFSLDLQSGDTAILQSSVKLWPVTGGVTMETFSLSAKPNIINESVSRTIHEQRTIKVPTSSWYKLIGLLSYFPPPPGIAICLADGSAGFSFLLSRLNSISHVYYNTLFDQSKAMDQACPNFIPSAFVGFPGNRRKLLSLRDTIEGITNLTSPEFQARLYERVRDFKTSIVISDAEGSVNYDPYTELILIQNCFKIGHENLSPIIMVKFYLGSQSFLRAVISLASSYYNEVYICRSLWSNSGNLELYVVGKQYKDVSYNPTLYLAQDEILITGYSINLFHTTRLHNSILQEIRSRNIPQPKCNEVADRLLEDPYSLNYHSTLFHNWFGINKKQWTFPDDLIRSFKHAIDPIRFQHRTRRKGMINLLKFQRARSWSMAWLAMLRFFFHLNLEEVVPKAMFVMYQTRFSWQCGIFWSHPQSFSSTKLWELKTLLTSADISLVYNVAGLLRKKYSGKLLQNFDLILRNHNESVEPGLVFVRNQ